MKVTMVKGLIAFTMCACLIACSEQSEISKDDLTGYWEVVDASRNKVKTKTLNGARFIITKDQFTTDMTGEEVSQEYEYTAGQLTTADQIQYSVERLNLDTMELDFVIRNMIFSVTLKKNDDINGG